MKVQKSVFMLVSALLCGILGGAIIAFVMTPFLARRSVREALSVLPAFSKPTSTTPTISLIPAERRGSLPLVPPALKNRASALAFIYRATNASSLNERFLGPERLLGRAVALTTDGWFVTLRGSVEGLRLADVTIWQNGSSFPIERMVMDRVNGAVFLKTRAQGVSAPVFTQAREIANGMNLWLETLPDGFAPDIVVAAGFRLHPNDSVSSESASRRVLASRIAREAEHGSAAWNQNGSLLGLVESKSGEPLRLIPASTLASSFAALLEQGIIHHATLGIRAVDLGTVRVDRARAALPDRGALIREIKRNSPAQNAGLKIGDVILRVERDILDGTADLGEILAEYKPGASVTLRVFREGKDLDLSVALGSAVTSELMK